jgi:uncharacterized protein YcbK (DUF882 family)
MKTSTDLTTADRTAAAQRAATAAPIRAGLTSARAELFARTFAVWRMRAENGQGTNASSDLSTPSDAANTDAAKAQAAHDTAQRDAASADGAHRAWRQMIQQVAAGPSVPDVATAFVSRVMPVDRARTESVDDRTTEVDRALTEKGDDKGKDEKDATATRRKDVMTATDTNAPVKDVNTLDPALRDRLDRVVARMEQAGHTVTVTEAVRSQPRQDALYAQGRTAPGPVVTWTRQSRHLDGLAVDVKVDGSYNNPEAYALLGKIANEEGLSTLGAKDPGHLELHADDALASLGQMATIQDAQITVEPGASRSSRVAQVAQVAQVARVAQVAQPAQVAQVAAVANPGATMPAPANDAPTVFARSHHAPINTADIARPSQPAPNTSINGGNPNGSIVQNAQAVAIAAALGANATGEGAENAFSQGGQAGQRGRAAIGSTTTRAESVRAAISNITGSAIAGAMGTGGIKGPSMGGIGTSATRGAATAMRADEIQSLIESRDRQPMSRMLLTVDDEMGGVDRIRVDVRGSRVGAQMMFGENGDAQQAAGRVLELARALEQRGLAPDALKVANAAAGSATELARAAAPAADRGNSTATRQDDGSRSQQDQPRQRSRKEQGEPR